MSDELRKREIVRKWISAAETFCNARTPNYGRLMASSINTYLHYADIPPLQSKLFANLTEAGQAMAEHLTKAKPYRGRDRLDQALLGSTRFASEASACMRDLSAWSVAEGLLSSKDAEMLLVRLRLSMSRRKRMLLEGSKVRLQSQP